MCLPAVLEWRNTVRAVLFSILSALRDLRAEFLSVYLARVFIFRGTRRMTSERREGLR